jgi:hypothetical protein
LALLPKSIRRTLRSEFVMEKLIVYNNKTLRLSNLLKRKISEQERENNDLVIIVEQMSNYIKSKGYNQIGPLIQYAKAQIGDDGRINVSVELLLQADNYIHHTEDPYTMVPLLRVKNCMYVRFTDIESKLGFAYDKIKVTAYEEDIELTGDSYTIIVDKTDERMVADVFMGKKEK